MKELTQRQQEVLSFITEYIHTHRFPPTMREIADHYSISVKAAHDHVTAMKKKGYIRTGDKRSRTIELTRLLNGEDLDGTIKIPFLGTVAAGLPSAAEAHQDGAVPIHRSMLKRNRDYFALKVRGDSMEGAGILDGDTAIIEKQEIVRNGEIVVALLNDSVTLKRFFREASRVRLQPENSQYAPIYTQELRILGRLAYTIRSY